MFIYNSIYCTAQDHLQQQIATPLQTKKKTSTLKLCKETMQTNGNDRGTSWPGPFLHDKPWWASTKGEPVYHRVFGTPIFCFPAHYSLVNTVPRTLFPIVNLVYMRIPYPLWTVNVCNTDDQVPNIYKWSNFPAGRRICKHLDRNEAMSLRQPFGRKNWERWEWRITHCTPHQWQNCKIADISWWKKRQRPMEDVKNVIYTVWSNIIHLWALWCHRKQGVVISAS